MNCKMMLASALLIVTCSSAVFAQDQVVEICNQLLSDEQKRVLCGKIAQLQNEAAFKAQQIKELQANSPILPEYAKTLISLFSGWLITNNEDIKLKEMPTNNIRNLMIGILGGCYIVSLTGQSLFKDVVFALSAGVLGGIVLEMRDRMVQGRRY